MEYATVLHACCCGCGNKVVTPLAPGRWRLMYDGKTISLEPSVGNWSFPCQSHYWIERSAVIWDRRFTRAEIAAVRGSDRRDMGHVAPQTAERARRVTPPAWPIGALTHAAADWWRRLLRRRRD
jgi:hypothetical protein